MLSPADVLNIQCEFVRRMKMFIVQRKYIMDLCLCKLYPYYVDSQLVTLLADCLDHADECELQKKASTYTPQDPVDPTTTSCEDQIAIDITSKTTSCTYTVTANNRYNGSSYPSMIITPNSEYINGTIDLKLTNSCNSTTEVTAVLGGCTSAGCSDDHKATIGRGISFGPTHLSSTSYITVFRIYETDQYGLIVNTPIDLDLNPATSPYYAAGVNCPGCATVNSADVLLGSANFAAAFQTLMDNVSLARHGATDRHRIYVRHYPSLLQTVIGSTFLHSPTDYLFGVNWKDIKISVFNPVTGKTPNFTGTNNHLYTPIRFYSDDVEYDVSCQTLNPIIPDQWTFPSQLYVQSQNANFNYIELPSPYGESQYPIVSDPLSVSCVSYTLTASYTPTDDVVSVEWRDGSSTIISTSDTVTVTDSDDYIFAVTLENGCVVTKSITI